MDHGLLLISHSVKKATSVEAQISSFSPAGEFVTTYYAPITDAKNSRLQKFYSKLFKHFSKSQDTVPIRSNSVQTAHLNDNEVNNRDSGKTLDSNNHIKRIATFKTTARDSRRENLTCNLDRPHGFKNPFYLAFLDTGNRKLYSSGSTSVTNGSSVVHYVDRIPTHLDSFVGAKEQYPPKKYRFKSWLNEKLSKFSYGGVQPVLKPKDIYSAVAEEAASIASIRGKSKAACRAAALTVSAYARVKDVSLRTSVSHDTTIKIIREACKDILSVSLVPKWKNIDYIRLFSIYHYEINLRKSQYCDSLRRSTSNFATKGVNIKTATREPPSRYELVPTQQSISKESSNNGNGNITVIDLEHDSVPEEDNVLSMRTKKWMNLLVSRINLYGGVDEIRKFGDEPDNINGPSSFKDASIEIETTKIDYFDSSWIDVLLPHIDYNPSPSYVNSDGISTIASSKLSAANPSPFSSSCNYSGNSINDLEPDFDVPHKKNIEGIVAGIDDGNTLKSIADIESVSSKDGIFPDCDSYLVGFAKTYLRIEILNSNFERICSQVDEIISGTEENSLVGELSPSEDCHRSLISADSTKQTTSQVDELLSLIDIAIVSTSNGDSRISTRSISTLFLSDDKSLFATENYRISDMDNGDSCATKTDTEQITTNVCPPVNSLIAQIDSVITNFVSSC